MRFGNWFKCGQYKEYSTLSLRIILGIILIVHGYGKLFGSNPGMAGFTGYVASVGVPLAVFFAWAVALIEFFGGIGILFGFWTRPIATIVIIEFIVIALFFVRSKIWLGAELELLILAAAISLSLTGAGRYSLEKILFNKEAWS